MTLHPLFTRRNIIPAAAALSFLATLPGCFTGIESTPKITQADVNRHTTRTEQHAAESQRRLLEGVTRAPFSQWQPGKRLVVTDPRIARALTPASAALSLSADSVLEYIGTGGSLTVMGDSVADLLFTPVGRPDTRLTYRTQLTPEALRRARAVYVPFTVEQDMVEQASARLSGQKVWIMTTRWFEPDGTTPVDRLKYVPVTIERVEPGSADYPLRVIFTSDGDSRSYGMLVADGSTATSARTFTSLFSLTDPRRQHGDISDATWRNITAGKVATDMTRDECRLALGAPAEVETSTGISNVVERWTYTNGVYLIFENGLLTRFRQ